MWPIMTQLRLLQQAAARLFHQETCLVFVICVESNGMQISVLSFYAIIYGFIVNEKKLERGLKSVRADSSRVLLFCISINKSQVFRVLHFWSG